MSDIQTKITRHTKRQEDTTYKQKNQSQLKPREQTQMLESAEEGIQTVIITVFHTDIECI